MTNAWYLVQNLLKIVAQADAEEVKLKADKSVIEEIVCEAVIRVPVKVKKQRKNAAKIHLCNICGTTCPSNSKLQRHLLQRHRNYNDREFPCFQCTRKFIFKNDLCKHVAETHQSAITENPQEMAM